MDGKTNPLQWPVTRALLSAVGLGLIVFLWEGRTGFNLWDEGFLWYGVQRVMAGDVPLRDFMAYDPGRYYWSGALLSVAGENGIMALRGTVAVFQVLGLFAGLWLLARASGRSRSLVWLLAAGLTLVVWMFPRHKLFDISLSIALAALLAFLAERPTLRRYFVAGAGVGLTAVFGRNHGLYGVAGSLGLMVFLLWRRERGPAVLPAAGAWAGGVAVGYSPMLLMLWLCPGFANAVWEGIRFLFEVKATNLPLPVPWPWLVPFGRIAPVEAARGVLIGVFFMGTMVFGVAGLSWAVWSKWRGKPLSPAGLACICLALPYTHYAFSRADVGHLAQGVFPLLMGLLVFLAEQRAAVRWPALLGLCGASLFVMLPFHPGWQCRQSGQWVEAKVGHDTLKIDPSAAKDLILLETLVARYAPAGRDFLVTPFWPGAYAVAERRAPVWEIYALFPRSESFERAEIERIRAAHPAFVLILDLALDGREELRYRNTHPRISRYVGEHFEPVQVPGVDPAFLVYRAKDPAK